MSKRGTHEPAQAASGPPEAASAPERLVSAFNELRDELVSTLWFVLGNREDAQDAAQEAFLKCWRAQASVTGVENLRAWIFRVGLNAAKDMRRSAWHRRSRALQGEAFMLQGPDSPPGEALENRETMDRLRLAIMQLRQEEKEVFR